MPDSQDCSALDFSKYDNMSTQELQQLLREDASKSEGEESDTAMVLYVMEVLAQRARAQQQGKTPEEALKSFKEQYDTQNFFVSEKDNRNRNIHSKQLWKRGLVAAAVVAVLVVGGSVTAAAFGVDLWQTIAKWTKETFHFDDGGRVDDSYGSDVADAAPYQGLMDALTQLGIHDLELPTWMPEGYTEVDVRVTETPFQRQITALYECGENSITFRINGYIDRDPERIEQSESLIEIYAANGVEYYIFDNCERVQAVWIVDSYECYISGSISLSESKAMIDSIQKER